MRVRSRYGKEDMKAKSEESRSEELFNFDKIFILFHRDGWFSWNEKTHRFRASQASNIAPSRMFSTNRRSGDDSKTQIGLETEKKKKKVWKCTWTYVRFFCRSFASVFEVVVLLPQCSRSSLSRLLSPAAIAASPGSSADLWTKRTCGILWLDLAHNRIFVWCSCGQPAIWGTFWGFVCFNAHF